MRLAELKHIVDKRDIANIQTSTQRYSATAGQLTEFVLQKKNLADKKAEARELLLSHLPVVEELKSAYNDTTAEWRFVEHDVDYLKIYISQLSL